MKSILQQLLKLQAIQFNQIKSENDQATVAQLRGQIPTQILGHYDRLVAHGKKGVAFVRQQSCTACHMSVPLGAVLTLRHGDDIVLCENCGRYLYLDESTEATGLAKKNPPNRKSKQLVST